MKTDIKKDTELVRTALQIAATAKPNPILEYEHAMAAFERIAEKARRYEEQF
jgi:hypothetical protein